MVCSGTYTKLLALVIDECLLPPYFGRAAP
jgi:hypothetical protein